MAGRKHQGGRGRGHGYPDRGFDRGRGRGGRGGRGRSRGRGAPDYAARYEDDYDFAADIAPFRMSNLSRSTLKLHRPRSTQAL